METETGVRWGELLGRGKRTFLTGNGRLGGITSKEDSARVLRPLNGPSDAAPLPLRQATEEEVGADRELRAMRQRAGPGRWLAFRAIRPLPKAMSFGVVFEAGLPSAEGLVTTETNQSYGFCTYSPLALNGITCSWGDGCPPLAPRHLHFNSPLDAKAFDRRVVRVEPPLAGMKVEVTGDSLVIRGRSNGRTQYTVTVLPGLRDAFGQTLEPPVTTYVDVSGSAPRRLRAHEPALATTATIPLAPSKSQSAVPWWWSSAWYEHQNLRDERAEAFASLL